MTKTVAKRTKSKSCWNKYQKQNKTRHQVGLGITALICLIALIVVGKFISFCFNLNQPFSLDGSATLSSFDPGYAVKSQWSGQGVVNILFKAQEISLISLDVTSKKVTILKIPEDTSIEVPLGFGKWPIRSIYGLGEAENPKIGARLLEEAVSSAFGVPVDGYLIFPSTFASSAEETVINIRQNPLAFDKLLQAKTDLSFVELMKFWLATKSVRTDKVKVLDLGDSQLTDWVTLADGSKVLNLDKSKLDQFIQNNFSDQKVADEGLSIGIFNATNHPGLAEKAARVISNVGGRVVSIANSSEKLTKTIVSPKKSYTQKRVSEYFASCGNQKDCKMPAEVDVNRVDLIIVLGEDYYLRSTRQK